MEQKFTDRLVPTSYNAQYMGTFFVWAASVLLYKKSSACTNVMNLGVFAAASFFPASLYGQFFDSPYTSAAKINNDREKAFLTQVGHH